MLTLHICPRIEATACEPAMKRQCTNDEASEQSSSSSSVLADWEAAITPFAAYGEYAVKPDDYLNMLKDTTPSFSGKFSNNEF